MAKDSALQAALVRSKRPTAAEQIEDEAATPTVEQSTTGPASPPKAAKSAKRSKQTAPAATKHGDRKGFTTWLPEQALKNLHMARAMTERPIQDLMLEALNDLFARMNLPHVRDD